MTERIGIIGGSGLYNMDGLDIKERIELSTPFGSPSDAYVLGTFAGKEVVFLPRHGKGHRFPAHQVNYRANIYGMKKLGVGRILSVSATGSLRERYEPGDIVLVDQFFDRTRNRASTFFEDGIAVHILFADPICPRLNEIVYDAAKDILGEHAHKGGAYLCMNGPQLSTRAESHAYRSWGMDIIGMTNLTEAKLAREAEICYCTIAMITDYDCWKESDEPFSAEKIIETFNANIGNARKILKNALEALPAEPDDCACRHALQGALMANPESLPAEVRERLDVIAGRYWI